MAKNNSRGFITIVLFFIAFFLVIAVIIAAIAIPGMIKRYFTFNNPLAAGTGNNDSSSSTLTTQNLEYPKNLDPTSIANCLNSYIKNAAPATSYLLEKGLAFAQAGKQYNVNPALTIAIAGQESSFGTSVLAQDHYNFFSEKGLSGNYLEFESVEKAIIEETSYIDRGYLHYTTPVTTIEGIGAIYAPLQGDTTGLNAHWVPGVTKNFNAIVSACPNLK